MSIRARITFAGAVATMLALGVSAFPLLVWRVDGDRYPTGVFAVAGGTMVVITVGVLWFLARWALRPLRDFTEMTSHAYGTGTFGYRLPEPLLRAETCQLGRGFNTLMDCLHVSYRRVADSLDAQRRLTADASHELRTPMTVIRHNAEFLLRHPDAGLDHRTAALGDIADECKRMMRLIDDMLAVAKTDISVPVRRGPVDLAALCLAVTGQAARLHPDRVVTYTGEARLVVSGDEDLLRQLLWILLNNAVKFTSDGGIITVALHDHGTSAHLTVADDGVGIPPDVAPHVFERAAPGGSARQGSGSGLGLAIAKWIATTHHGIIEVAGVDHGATLRVDLPIMTHEPATTYPSNQ